MTKESKIWAEAEREIRRIHKHEPTDKLCDEDLCEIQAFIKGAKWVMEEYREQSGEVERLKMALRKIHEMKEPGNNGFNKCWHIADHALAEPQKD